MKNPNRTKLLSLLAFFLLSAISFAQTKAQNSPFEKYKKSTTSEFEFRKLQFQVEAMRASLPPNTPLPKGVGVPFVYGETSDGKLVIEVEVWGSDLPKDVDARKESMYQAIVVSTAAFSFAFHPALEETFKKWTVIQFSDSERFQKAHGKVVDPYIGNYENGELVLR